MQVLLDFRFFYFEGPPRNLQVRAKFCVAKMSIAYVFILQVVTKISASWQACRTCFFACFLSIFCHPSFGLWSTMNEITLTNTELKSFLGQSAK